MQYVGKDCKQIDWNARIEHWLKEIEKGYVQKKLLKVLSEKKKL